MPTKSSKFLIILFSFVALFSCESQSPEKPRVDQDQMLVDVSDMGESSQDIGLDISTANHGQRDSSIEMDMNRSFENVEGGQPLNPEVGLYPYPSEFFQVNDPSTNSGLRVEIPASLFPKLMPSEAFDGHDGFSRMPMILSAWPRGIDVTSLDNLDDIAASITDRSSTIILRHGESEKGPGLDPRVPHLVEVDLTTDNELRRALIIRPAAVLEPLTRYTVAIRSGLRDIEGRPYQPNRPYQALKNALRTGQEIGYHPLDQQVDQLAASKRVIEANGLEFEDYVLVWSFVTRSRQQLTKDLLTMQSRVVDWSLGDYVVTEEFNTAENLIIRGEIDMPRYAGERGLERDESGEPVMIDVTRYPFSMAIPTAVSEPRPVILFGHGFLGDHPQSTRSSFNELCVRGQFNAIGMNFGMHEGILPSLLLALSGDINAYHRVRAEVMQTMVNYSVMTRYIEEKLSIDYPKLDPARTLYMGISNGGTFGYLYSATSELVKQAILVVGGGGLSHFLQRATQWQSLSFIVTREFSDPLKLQLFLAMLQDQLDPIDPINYVDRLISPRFENRQALRAQVHMAVNDSQVHNMVTEWVARSAQIPLITPSPKEIWGLNELITPLNLEQQLELPSAMYVYDEQVTPYPGGNLAPEEDNGTHGTVRRVDSYQRHIIDFINEGRIDQVCEGACDPD